MTETVGTAFARALAAKDHERVRDLLDDGLDFRAMTPGRIWEAAGAAEVVNALQVWFGDDDRIEELVLVDTDTFADRERVGYRLRVSTPDGPHLVEQQAYLSAQGGRIQWMRIMCSGFRPVG